MPGNRSNVTPAVASARAEMLTSWTSTSARARRFRQLCDDRETKRSAARVLDDREIVLIGERQAQHLAREPLRTSRVGDEKKPDERSHPQHLQRVRQLVEARYGADPICRSALYVYVVNTC